MKKLIILLIFLLCVNSVFAINEKVKIKNCEIAFLREDITVWNDTAVNNIFNTPWDGEIGKFAKLTNNNLVMGESSDYSYEYYSTERQWSNSEGLGLPTDTNSFPILDVEDKDSYIYLKCTYKIGDFRFFPTFSLLYLYNYMSTDFNVTNLITEDLAKQTFYGNTYSKQQDAILSQVNSYYIYRNNYVPGEEGFFPNTEPYEVWKFDVKNKPSSLMHFTHYLIRDQGMVNILDLGWNDLPWFYVEGKEDLGGYLLPNRGSIIIENEDTGEKSDQWNAKLKVIPGDTYRYIVNYTNPYSIPIQGLTINHGYFYSNNLWCFDRGTLNPPGVISTLPYTEEIVNIPIGGTATITDSFTVPNDKLICNLVTHNILISASGSGKSEFPHIGSDETAYLSFKTLDTSIEPVAGKTSLVIDTELFVTDWEHNLPVQPGDYEIIGRVFFESISSTPIFEETMPVNFLPKGSTPFTWVVEMNPTWEIGNYYVKLFSKPKTGRFAGQEIIMLKTDAYIKPEGQLHYPPESGTNFYFYNDSKSITDKITLFNKDLTPHTFTIETTLSDNSNYSFNLPTSVYMNPLETKEITLIVNALYDPWPKDEIIENMVIKVTTDTADTLSINYKLKAQPAGVKKDTCVDGGDNFYLKHGVTISRSSGSFTINDSCDFEKVKEIECVPCANYTNCWTTGAKYHLCPEGCLDGACQGIPPPIPLQSYSVGSTRECQLYTGSCPAELPNYMFSISNIQDAHFSTTSTNYQYHICCKGIKRNSTGINILNYYSLPFGSHVSQNPVNQSLEFNIVTEDNSSISCDYRDSCRYNEFCVIGLTKGTEDLHLGQCNTNYYQNLCCTLPQRFALNLSSINYGFQNLIRTEKIIQYRGKALKLIVDTFK